MDALTGVNDSRLGIVDPRQAAHLRLDRLRAQVEAGAADTAKLQQRLTAALGSKAAGIVGDDGSVDFERLREFAADQGSARLLLELTARLDADDVDVTEDVVVGGNDIRVIALVGDNLILLHAPKAQYLIPYHRRSFEIFLLCCSLHVRS